MYRYLWEEPCFDRAFEAQKPVDTNLQRGVRRIISENLGINYDEVHLVFYKKNPNSIEVEYEAQCNIDRNYVFKISVMLSTYDRTLVSLKTHLCRVDPVYLRDFHNQTESIVSNMFREFAKKSFYQDLLAEYRLKYEDMSRKLFEQLEVLFNF